MRQNSKTPKRTGSDSTSPEKCHACLKELLDEMCDGNTEGGPWWMEALADIFEEISRSQKSKTQTRNGSASPEKSRCPLEELVYEEAVGGPWWMEYLQEQMEACRKGPKKRRR